MKIDKEKVRQLFEKQGYSKALTEASLSAGEKEQKADIWRFVQKTSPVQAMILGHACLNLARQFIGYTDTAKSPLFTVDDKEHALLSSHPQVFEASGPGLRGSFNALIGFMLQKGQETLSTAGSVNDKALARSEGGPVQIPLGQAAFLGLGVLVETFNQVIERLDPAVAKEKMAPKDLTEMYSRRFAKNGNSLFR